MVCPRCQGECDAAAVVCPRCAAPLLLGEDPAPAPLDRALDLDRRIWLRGPEVPPERPLAPPRAPDGERPRNLLRWRRGAAWAVDAGVVALFTATPIAAAAGPGVAPGVLLPHTVALAGLIAFAYGTLCDWLAGATAGKRLLGLQVIELGGGRPGLGRAAARAALAVVGAGCGVPLHTLLFTDGGRALHDRVSGTAVVSARLDPPCREV